ncbi:MAG: hypothetical protein JRJ12_13695 [Deltaproteobacteria bacterium]|nr:hypothetical protein [Deltaproteobacteria bacterium]
MLFIPFFYMLRDQGIPVSLQQVLEFYQAVHKGLAPDLDRLFILMRLVFVKKVEHFDAFEQAFSVYFLGTASEILQRLSRHEWDEKAFYCWLREQVDSGHFGESDFEHVPMSELLQRFLETASRQQGKHRGGHTWIGTEGSSPFGHSGSESEGIRVHGEPRHSSAVKVIEARRYVDYADSSMLRTENLRQVLAALKHMVPAGPPTELDVDETVYRSSRNGGEIELVFERELRDRIKLVVLMDNGGSSMNPYVNLVRLIFAHMRDHFRDLDYYYFHNCIYGCVFSDPQRRTPVPLHEFLSRDPETRLIIIGDANMAPAELLASNGAIDYFSKVRLPARDWLQQIRHHFRHSVWLNPIPRERWPWESRSITLIGRIFPMEDLTLHGIRRAVEWLNSGAPPRRGHSEGIAL